jgi:nucleoside-diphosphate-sugar epimerase
MKCLVTGSSGFIAQSIIKGCANHIFSTAGRSVDVGRHTRIEKIDSRTDWSVALKNQEVVIHTAAIAHVSDGDADDQRRCFDEVNVQGTLNLAQQAAENGTQRFVFISSIGVNGFVSDKLVEPGDLPRPYNDYTRSKCEAEIGLKKIATATGIELVIIRKPLVYGINAKGSFSSLVGWVKVGVPLPLGAIHRKRSFVGLDNLVDLIITCINHPGAVNETFLVSDGEDLSTTQLLQGVAEAMGKPSRLIPIPAGLLQFGATLLGKKAMAQRLLGSLQVDISHTQKCLNWTPPLTVKQGLQRCFPNQQD